MNLNKNIVLLGMMGSGKSTIGFLISKKLNIKFIDIDQAIEKNMHMSIEEIFKTKGENFFRNLEEKITIKYLNTSNNVISLGGGGFMNDKIRKEVITNHYSFWLNWKNSTIINRILKSKKRPVAFNSSENNLKRLINERSNIYAKANFKINCETLTKKMIVKNILELYEKN